MPLVTKTFDQLLDFTRTSSATFVGSNGLIQNTAASRNLLTFTQEFDNAAWSKTNTTVAANSAVAPDGTSTADTLTANSSAGAGQQVFQTITNAGSGNYVYSIYVKQGSGATDSNSFLVRNQTTGVNPAVISFNYQTGVVTQTEGSSATAVNVGNDWWRLSIPFTLTATIGDAIRFYAGSSGAVETPGEFLYAWGAQVEAVSDANLVLGSEIVTNGGFATDTNWTKGAGWTISSGAAQASAGAFSAITQSISFTAGKSYRVSFDVTAYSAGNIRASFTGGTQVTGAARAATGQYLVYMTAVTGNNLLAIGADGSGFTGTIDNVTVKEITGTVGMPSTYTRNNGGVFPPRFDYDPVTLAPKGLLIEEQRTNLALQSDLLTTPTWTGVRIDRTTNGNYARLTATENNVNGGFFTYTPAPLAASTYTTSVNVSKTSANKFILRPTNPLNSASVASVGVDPATGVATTPSASVDFSNPSVKVEDRGSDWRVSLTFTTLSTIQVQMRLFVVDATSGLPVTLGANIDVRYAQFEAGAFATSYIPTVASQVTRTADICSIVAPNFAPWYNQSEGTFVSEFSFFASNDTVNSKAYFAVSDGTSNNRVYGNVNSVAIPFVFVAVGNVAQANMSTGTAITNNTVAKVATAYKANDFAAVLNAGTVTTDTSGTVPTVNKLDIGNLNNFSQLNGHIRSIRYYPTRLTNAQLQALTA